MSKSPFHSSCAYMYINIVYKYCTYILCIPVACLEILENIFIPVTHLCEFQITPSI